ncbi:unnamed protein product [Gulo gulo]|uniref:Uncharacterized protein n=1 Tax=Gulo gulo TaxID=48420 RepID=A0A9X9LGG1_GULGU|nr:unnamed protein product [Gulo gulo]
MAPGLWAPPALSCRPSGVRHLHWCVPLGHRATPHLAVVPATQPALQLPSNLRTTQLLPPPTPHPRHQQNKEPAQERKLCARSSAPPRRTPVWSPATQTRTAPKAPNAAPGAPAAAPAWSPSSHLCRRPAAARGCRPR